MSLQIFAIHHMQLQTGFPTCHFGQGVNHELLIQVFDGIAKLKDDVHNRHNHRIGILVLVKEENLPAARGRVEWYELCVVGERLIVVGILR